ncbi:MAG: hypothetical protein NTY83_00950 [Candidatus Micrarchaeota archaeon]|nr:hypothetical protein [Candidatus Micrarchaeota archaeon]
MGAAEEADDLVCKVRGGKASANDALLILKRLEKIAKPDGAERLKQARAVLEDAAATEKMRVMLRAARKRGGTGNPGPKHLRRLRA